MENQIRILKVQSDDLEDVVSTVKKYINTYEVQVTPIELKFLFFYSDNPDFSDQFDNLRKELVPRGYIPFVQQDGENFVGVTRRPPTKYRDVWVNLVMLILTLASTVYVGSQLSADFVSPGPGSIYVRFLYGLVFFSLPLMFILGIHEFGHYLVAKRFAVKASLPFFIPFPIGLGTFGAFISLRDPIPNRKAMAEIGAAGPMFGFLTALPLLFVANYLKDIFHAVPGAPPYPYVIHLPFIYPLFGLSSASAAPVFPMVFAVWVGMFATAMNLLPVGQLDGGHVARGILGKRSSFIGYAFVIFLIVIGIYYTGWWILAIFVIFVGINHPPALDDYSKLSRRDIGIGLFCLLMFILTFTIVPLSLPA
ncbi:MAG: site-2 protease family protein [Thermoplasmataceae archaeon]